MIGPEPACFQTAFTLTLIPMLPVFVSSASATSQPVTDELKSEFSSMSQLCVNLPSGSGLTAGSVVAGGSAVEPPPDVLAPEVTVTVVRSPPRRFRMRSEAALRRAPPRT